VSEEEAKPEVPSAPILRGLRTMAIVRWVLLGTVALVAALTWWIYVFHAPGHVAGPDKYYCPMHPQIRSAAPGTCPICFMKLEPIPEERMGQKAPPAEAPPPPPPPPGETPQGLSSVMLTLERRQAVGVATAPATKRAVSRELRLPAVIEAPEKAVSEVRVRTAGFVERVASVETGQRVQAGQPLLWIYSPDILRAEEELLTARRLAEQSSVPAGLTGSAANGADNGSSGHALGAQVSDAARQRLLLLGVHETDIDRIVQQGRAERVVPVRATGSGVVTARQVSVGSYATPEMLLFQVTDLSKVWASATVSVEDVARVTPGVRGRFVSRGKQAAYEVEASLVEPQVSSETRSGRVRFVASNKDDTLRPGDIGEVIVSLPMEELVLVPRDAVIDVGNVRYVYVERSAGLFVPKAVETGPLVGDERAVLHGVEAGALVVTRGAFLLDSESRLGAAVAATPEPGAGAPAPTAAPPAMPHDHAHGHEAAP
jgi:RND family efflux transporter MFP subunit